MKRLISIAMLALLLCSVSLAQDDAAKKKAAQASAESWMALVDAGDYAQSWQPSCVVLQRKGLEGGLGEDGWFRWQPGSESLRTACWLRHCTRPSFQGAPGWRVCGDPVQKRICEPTDGHRDDRSKLLDKDGKWHVSGYFIKPAEQ